MSCWIDETIPMLRVLLNDMDPFEYEFTDHRLTETLLVSAKYISQEISFATTYTISIGNELITPDPAVAPDDAFMNFMVLKAACIIDIGSARVASMTAGLEAKCGPAVMKTLKQMDGFATLLDKGACATYEETKQQYIFGNVEWAAAILSPFTNRNVIPSYDFGDSGNGTYFNNRRGYNGNSS